jgi:hypothetical protein
MNALSSMFILSMKMPTFAAREVAYEIKAVAK